MLKKKCELTEDEIRLLKAADKGERETVQRLLERGTDPNAHEEAGHSALILACDSNDADVALLLIEAGAEPNYQSEMGDTPLHLACLNGNQRIVEALIKAGADIHLKDGGVTPLDTAVRCRHDKIAEILRQAQEKKTTQAPR